MVFNEIKKIVLKVIKNINEEEIKSKSRLVEDLGADSLNYVEIIMDIEERFNIQIPEKEIEKIKTIEDIIKNIEERIIKQI